MKTSEQLDALAAALAKAQNELRNIEKSKINPHFKSRYADIADGLEVIRPILSKHGIALVQATAFNSDTGMFVLHTRLLHSSGQWIEGTYPLPTSGKATEIGSAITYGRRYSAFSLVGVAGIDEDDDAAAANNTAPVKPAAKGKAPVDKDAFMERAKKVASEGTDSLRAWWKDLPQSERSILSVEEINDLKQAAAQVVVAENE